MAKLSQVLRDKKREKLIAKYADRRAELRAKMKDPDLDPDEKAEVMARLDRLPLNSCPTRLTRRCFGAPLRRSAPLASSASTSTGRESRTTGLSSR